MVDEEHVKAQLKKHFEVDGKVNINQTTGLVDVDGDVKLKEKIKVTQLPVSFDRVVGDFDCYNNKLTDLKGAPTSVVGDFDCYNNKLTDLKGAPTSVGGGFYCSSNQLTSLEGAPTSVGGDFYCYNNNLVSLEGAPTSVGGDFYCYNNNLVSLEGAPKDVGGNFWCDYNKNLPLLRLLAYQRIRVFDAPESFDRIFEKRAGTGRRGAIQAAREMLELGEQLQKEQSLDHNPFEANARW
jgi:hypothetical protein